MLKEKMWELVESFKKIEKEENRTIEAYEIYEAMWKVSEINEVDEEVAESIYEDIVFNLGYTKKKHFNYVEYR